MAKRSILQRVWSVVIAFAAFACVVVLAHVILPITTPEFRDPKGGELKNSEALAERWVLNGVKQSVVIRGRDSSRPALVWVSDFWCETPLFRHFNADLENHFLVVYWCPRYSGQSFDPFVAAPKSLTLSDYASDLAVLVDRVRARFHKEKVVLVAHSSGTNYGLIYAAHNSDKVLAYVGVGQLANASKNYELQFNFDLQTARALGNSEAIAELTPIGGPPFSNDNLQLMRKWAILFRGAFHADLSYSKLAFIGAQSHEANWRDLYAFLWGNSYTEVVADEQNKIDFNERYLKFEMPVYFLSGRFDHRADSGLAEGYLAKIEAPKKAFVWFENSAHSPPFEEPELFNTWIVANLGVCARDRC